MIQGCNYDEQKFIHIGSVGVFKTFKTTWVLLYSEPELIDHFSRLQIVINGYTSRSLVEVRMIYIIIEKGHKL
jgi:hypothetical protein